MSLSNRGALATCTKSLWWIVVRRCRQDWTIWRGPDFWFDRYHGHTDMAIIGWFDKPQFWETSFHVDLSYHMPYNQGRCRLKRKLTTHPALCKESGIWKHRRCSPVALAAVSNVAVCIYKFFWLVALCHNSLENEQIHSFSRVFNVYNIINNMFFYFIWFRASGSDIVPFVQVAICSLISPIRR